MTLRGSDIFDTNWGNRAQPVIIYTFVKSPITAFKMSTVSTVSSKTNLSALKMEMWVCWFATYQRLTLNLNQTYIFLTSYVYLLVHILYSYSQKPVNYSLDQSVIKYLLAEASWSCRWPRDDPLQVHFKCSSLDILLFVRLNLLFFALALYSKKENCSFNWLVRVCV